MRGIAYVVAAIAALGVMFVIATVPDPQTKSASQQSSTSRVAAEVMTEAGTLTLSVPEMHCQFACFPKVKETLEESEGVEDVSLAAQKEEGVLDNRQVIVKYQPGFDARAAITSLEAAGYKNSDIVY
jgi:copper chaperone CopZ